MSAKLVLGIQIGLFILTLACFYLIFKRRQLHKYEHIHQQKKYLQWSKVQPLNDKQLAALQLIAFERYNDGFWTDSLENRPVEVRLEHITDFRNKLDYFEILTKEEFIEHYADAQGMTSKAKYEKLYNKLINGMHTPQFLIDLNAYPDWKDRILDLTNLSETYFDACFQSSNGKPKKLTWEWDLWRVISLSAAAFMCGFISDKEAWEKIYKVSDLAHYLFDDLEDFYKNMRMGHAYWANNEKMVFERKKGLMPF